MGALHYLCPLDNLHRKHQGQLQRKSHNILQTERRTSNQYNAQGGGYILRSWFTRSPTLMNFLIDGMCRDFMFCVLFWLYELTPEFGGKYRQEFIDIKRLPSCALPCPMWRWKQWDAEMFVHSTWVTKAMTEERVTQSVALYGRALFGSTQCRLPVKFYLLLRRLPNIRFRSAIVNHRQMNRKEVCITRESIAPAWQAILLENISMKYFTYWSYLVLDFRCSIL